MNIIVAKNSGFCFGVERSLKLALSASKEASGNKKPLPVYTLGPLIHNPQVVSSLEKKGIKVVCDLKKIKKGVLIICSHGVSPESLKHAKRKKLKIIDATCPFVQKTQKLVHDLLRKKYQVVIVGDSSHPEVLSLLGFSSEKGIVVSGVKDIAKVAFASKTGVVAQTTQLISNLKDVVSHLLDRTSELRVYNTICEATLQRQKAARALAGKVDLMIIIGGYNSANTTRLAEVCKQQNPESYHIEKLADFDMSLLKGRKKIGITAGASTPQWLVNEVVEALAKID
ncbi:MAG: 4-hydroxy-3-methylbut-2-enyl diphosphate reductase [bacterium]